MKIRINDNLLEHDILLALVDHFRYSVADINNYNELTEEEKNIISEDTWNKMTY